MPEILTGISIADLGLLALVIALAALGAYGWVWMKGRIEEVEKKEEARLDPYTKYLVRKWDEDKESMWDEHNEELTK